MKVTVLLADAAQAIAGKLYILGGGWNITGPMPVPSAIALYIEVPWDQTNRRHRMKLQLLTADGQPVQAQQVAEQPPQPLEVGGDFEVGRPAGVVPGSPLGVSLAISIGAIPLPPNSRFVWRLTIDDETHEDWQLAFSTRPLQQGLGGMGVGHNP
jgi:hypothetical protein